MAFNWYKAKSHYNELHVNLYKLITQWCFVRSCICTKSLANAVSTVYTVFYIYVTFIKQVN